MTVDRGPSLPDGGLPTDLLGRRLADLALQVDPGPLDLPLLTGRAAGRRRRRRTAWAGGITAACAAVAVVLPVAVPLLQGGDGRLRVADGPGRTTAGTGAPVPERGRLLAAATDRFPGVVLRGEDVVPAGRLDADRSMPIEGLSMQFATGDDGAPFKGGDPNGIPAPPLLIVNWYAVDPPVGRDGPNLTPPGRKAALARVPLAVGLADADGVRAVAYRPGGPTSLAVTAWTAAGGLAEVTVTGPHADAGTGTARPGDVLTRATLLARDLAGAARNATQQESQSADARPPRLALSLGDLEAKAVAAVPEGAQPVAVGCVPQALGVREALRDYADDPGVDGRVTVRVVLRRANADASVEETVVQLDGTTGRQVSSVNATYQRDQQPRTAAALAAQHVTCPAVVGDR